MGSLSRNALADTAAALTREEAMFSRFLGSDLAKVALRALGRLRVSSCRTDLYPGLSGGAPGLTPMLADRPFSGQRRAGAADAPKAI